MNTTNYLSDLKAKKKRLIQRAHLNPYRLGVFGWCFIDFVTAFLAMLLAHCLSPAFGFIIEKYPAANFSFSPVLVSFVYSILVFLVVHIFGLHHPLQQRNRGILLVKSGASVLVAIILLLIISLLFLYQRIGRHVLIYGYFLTVYGLFLVRIAIWKLIEQRKIRILLVGNGEISRRIIELVNQIQTHYSIVAVYDANLSPQQEFQCGLSIVHENIPISELCLKHEIHEVVICKNERSTANEQLELTKSLIMGVRVCSYSVFCEQIFFKVPVEFIDQSWFFQIRPPDDYVIYTGIKRMIDIVVSILGLVLASPVLLFSIIFIKLESRGPAFYSQVRTGQFNQPFKIWKLRSMRCDAEKSGAQWAGKNDVRVTRIGRVLRKTRMDEVPQFWNILKGEMSLIGPRPERPEFVSKLSADIHLYEHRHLIKPGLTGWAQINYPYGASREDALNKLKYDLYYLKNSSLLLDLDIILKTIGAVMKGSR